MSCDNCNSGPAAREAARAKITQEAKAYGIKEKTGVVIWEDPLEGWSWCRESQAAGKPVVEAIPYFGSSAG